MITSLLIVFNLVSWISMVADVQHLEQTFAPLGLQISTLETSLTNIPWKNYEQQTRIDDNYLDTITRLATSSNLTAFVVSPDDWKATNAGGYSHTNKPIVTCEADNFAWFYECLSHELSHKYHELAGVPDKTHEYLATYSIGQWQSHFLQEFDPTAEKKRTFSVSLIL